MVTARAGGTSSSTPRDVEIEPAETLDTTRRLATVRLDGPAAEELSGDFGRAWHAIAVMTAAESVGLGQRAMEMAVAYAKDRTQFERPIGTYQAVSHACAQMLLEVEGARSAVLWAAWALDHEPETAGMATNIAKAYASDCGARVTASALQVHGGIGFTWEHDLHFFLKRAQANAHAYGDARWHRDELAAALFGNAAQRARFPSGIRPEAKPALGIPLMWSARRSWIVAIPPSHDLRSSDDHDRSTPDLAARPAARAGDPGGCVGGHAHPSRRRHAGLHRRW